jgi:hypothetical protein
VIANTAGIVSLFGSPSNTAAAGGGDHRVPEGRPHRVDHHWFEKLFGWQLAGQAMWWQL